MSSEAPLKKRKVGSPESPKEATKSPESSLSAEDLTITIEDITNSQTIKTLPMKANRYIKHILSQWEASPNTELLLETKKALFPMLVQLRKGTIVPDALTSLLTIFYHVQQKEYLKAQESYLKLSIGNVAWPIGVASVSIHSRTAQSMLDGGKKAMIMLDEPTRRWITAVKRLITFKERYVEETKSQDTPKEDDDK